MVKCWSCEEEYEWEEYVQFDCPECGGYAGEGFIQCEYCGSFINYDGDEWTCEFCEEEEDEEEEYQPEVIIERRVSYCPECGEELYDDGYCDCCGWPNNQGWIGENYG